jgi:hypothetical protein
LDHILVSICYPPRLLYRSCDCHVYAPCHSAVWVSNSPHITARACRSRCQFNRARVSCRRRACVVTLSGLNDATTLSVIAAPDATVRGRTLAPGTLTESTEQGAVGPAQLHPLLNLVPWEGVNKKERKAVRLLCSALLYSTLLALLCSAPLCSALLRSAPLCSALLCSSFTVGRTTIRFDSIPPPFLFSRARLRGYCALIVVCCHRPGESLRRARRVRRILRLRRRL